MPDLDGAPFVAIFSFFFAIVFVRTQATYWLARLVVVQTVGRAEPRGRLMARAHAWSHSPAAARGITALSRWGVLAVPLSFFTVGLKTIVNASAGLIQMPFRRYLPAMFVGCVIHSTIYATVGWAAWEAALAAAAGSPWGIAALVVLLLSAGGAVWWVRRRRSAAGVAGTVAQVPEASSRSSEET